jgi:hypothetical protein
MKRLAIKVAVCLASFTFGLAASSFLNWIKRPAATEQPQVAARRPAYVTDQTPPAIVSAPAASRKREAVLAGGRLLILSDQFQLKSQRLRYKIDVEYPQILGSDELHIRRLNQRLEQLVRSQSDWPMHPSKADLRYYREKWPEAFNEVYIDYDIVMATDSLLSIYFSVESYGIGAANAFQHSFVVNYDFTLRKEVKLSDIFSPRSKYLEFVSRYCFNELSKQSNFMIEYALDPRATNFESWNITHDGIRFNFDKCKVFSCADGQHAVEISFADLKEMLSKHALRTFTKQ